jgi:hypothetical protein
MAGTIIADYIRSDANRISLNVGNTIVASINASGILSNTGTVLISPTGAIDANNVTAGTLGKSRLPTGSILQVVQTQKTDTFSSQSQSFVDITGLSVSITPTSATSKILVCMNVMLGGTAHHDLKIVRGSTDIAIGDSAGNRVRGTSHMYRGYSGGVYDISPASMMWLDSPATTSSTTYKLQVASPYNAAYVAYINRVATDDDNSYNGRGVSTITVMEIAA